MKAGDLVKEVGLQERTGVILKVVKGFEDRGAKVVYKVLWDKHSPTSSTLVGAVWYDQLEVISESR